MDTIANFAFGVVLQPVSAITTTINLDSGEGVLFPTAPFYAFLWNVTDYRSPYHALRKNEAELVLVSSIVSDVATVTRAQSGTTARVFSNFAKTYELQYVSLVSGTGQGQSSAGVGSPESVVVGIPGQSYMDITDPALPKEYKKITGTGTTGWLAWLQQT